MPELVSDSFQRGSPSIPSLPLCTCHSSHQKMESIFLLSLNLDWPTTCHNQQNMVEVTLFQFQTWPLRRLAASISSLLDASHHVRNPTTRTPLHCEETPCWEREMPDQPQMFRPSQLSCHLCKWKGHPGHCLLQHLQTIHEAYEHPAEPNPGCRIVRNNKLLLLSL